MLHHDVVMELGVGKKAERKLSHEASACLIVLSVASVWMTLS